MKNKISQIINSILNFIKSALSNFFKGINKRLRFSISFKITTVYVLIFTLIFLMLSGGILLGFGAYLTENLSSNLKETSEVLSSFISESPVLPEKTIKDIAQRENMSITLFDEHLNITYSTNKDTSTIIYYNKLNSIKFDKTVNSYAATLNNKYESSSGIYYIQITMDLSKEFMYMGVLLIVLVILNIISIILAATSGAKASKKMLRPIEKMTKTVKEISIHALDTRLDVSGAQDELKELAETFNDMIDRIQKSYNQQNQFVSDASHELRTPISVIQGYVNLLDRWGKNDREVLEESISAIKSESENMKSLIEKLLFLARGDKNRQKVEKEFFLVNELIDEIVRETRMIDPIHNILNVSNEKVQINADRKLIKEALRAFIENSIKFTPESGTIKLNSYTNKRQLVIAVEDTGIGIPKEDLPYIFNRFYRADKSRTKTSGGSGLGLSIAKWIIQNHNGSIEVQSAVGLGTKITIYIPIEAS